MIQVILKKISPNRKGFGQSAIDFFMHEGIKQAK
jgi:hypothetical protein